MLPVRANTESTCQTCHLSCFEATPLTGAAFFAAMTFKEFIFGNSINAGIFGVSTIFSLITFAYIKQHKSIEKMTRAFERGMSDLSQNITLFSASCAQLSTTTGNLTPLLSQINNNLEGLRSDYQTVLLQLQNGVGTQRTQLLIDELRHEIEDLQAMARITSTRREEQGPTLEVNKPNNQIEQV